MASRGISVRRGARRGAIVASILLLSACGFGRSDGGGAQGGVSQELLDRINSHCSDLETPLLGEGTLCVDSGFRMTVDDFSFANYGRSQSADSNVTVQTLIDLFGHSAVCMPSDETRCVLRPTTMQKLEEWNNALAGGRCEGFATLSARFQLGIDDPGQYRPGVTRVADLKKSDSGLQPSIVYWWSTQFLREVSDRAAASRTKSPLALVDDLIQGIANRVGYTLGIYSANQGHSLTPFAVTRRGGSFVIHVYDNNFPGERKELIVDAESDAWSYASAAPDPTGGTVTWSGRTGTIELTPMSARQGPFECWFCTVSAIPSGAPTVISLASRDPRSPGYVRIATRGGGVIEASPGGLTNSIPGAVYSMSKGSTAGLVSVSIPSGAGDVDVEVRRASESVPAGDVVLTIQQPGAASVQVSGNLATLVAGTEGSGNPIIAVRDGDTTVSTPPGRIARVTTAAGSNLSRTTLDPGQSLTVTRVTNDTIEVSMKGSDGSPLGSVAVDASGADDSNVVVITPDPATKSLSTTSASVTSVKVEQREPIGGEPTPTTTSTQPAVSAPTTTVPTIVVTRPSTTTPANKGKGKGKNKNKSTTTTVPRGRGTTTTVPTTTSTTVAATTTVSPTTSHCPGNSCNQENNGGGNGNGNGGGGDD